MWCVYDCIVNIFVCLLSMRQNLLLLFPLLLLFIAVCCYLRKLSLFLYHIVIGNYSVWLFFSLSKISICIANVCVRMHTYYFFASFACHIRNSVLFVVFFSLFFLCVCRFWNKYSSETILIYDVFGWLVGRFVCVRLLI